MKYSRSYTHLGIAGALLIPTLAVAAVDIPNVFEGGDPVSAAEMNENFDTVAMAVDALETSVGALEARIAALEGAGLQPPTRIDTFSADIDTDVMAIYEVKTDGVMSFAPIGSQFYNATVAFDLGTSWSVPSSGVPSVSCEGNSCRVSRGYQGSSASVFVPAGSFVAISVTGLSGTARAELNWQPLHGPDPEGEGPERRTRQKLE